MRSRHHRLGLAAVGLAGAVVLVAGEASATATSGSPSAASTTTSASSGKTLYAVGKRVCKQPTRPGRAACFAMKRVLVKPGTNGARPLTPMGAVVAGMIGPAGGLSPLSLATAYALDTTGGAGQTVAIVDAYHGPTLEADLQVFDAQYGLATCTVANGCLTVMNQDGGSTLPANDTSGWSMEEALDVEAVHAVCQGCTIVVVEANSNANADLAQAENTAAAHAPIVSNSFGEVESYGDASYPAAFDHPGQVIVASTGDDGWYFFDQLAAYNQPSIPASFGTVVAVGGTSLYLQQDGTRAAEVVWNDNGPQNYWGSYIDMPLGAGGGGCSTMYPAPAWQPRVTGWSTTGCADKRLTADIAAVGDYVTGFDVYASYDCGSDCTLGWGTIGGTSLSAPIIAAMFGLAGGAQGIAYPALTLYGHRNSFYDVTVGGNGWCGGEGAAQCANPNDLGYGLVDCAWEPAPSTSPAVGNRACAAMPGYDGPTGLGTPRGLTGFAKTGPTARVSGPSVVTHGTTGTWIATVTDPFPGGTVVSYTWHWGDGTVTKHVKTGAASHRYLVAYAKRRVIRMDAKDNYGFTATKNIWLTVR